MRRFLMEILHFIIMSFVCFSLVACFGKPFQPPPPEYANWEKKGSTTDEIKQTMRSCGYKDLYGYGGDRNATLEDRVIRESCMFDHEYRHKDGFRGLCSLRNMESIAACHAGIVSIKENK
jgi:hypothetical protein